MCAPAKHCATWDAPVTRLEAGVGYSVHRNALLKVVYQHNDRDGGFIPTVSIGAEQVTLHLFVATLGFSRRAFVRVFDHERQSAWLDGLEGAFQYFGGLPEEVLLDNARALVEHHDPTTRIVVFNPRLLAFARYWGFQPRACAPYRARTQGKDERGVGYVKHHAIAGRTWASS